MSALDETTHAYAVEPPTLPAPAEARQLLVRLAVPEPDLDPVVASMPDPRSSPELWSLLHHYYRALYPRDLDDHDALRGSPKPPNLPASLGPAGRYFYVHVYLAALPVIRRLHDERGIPSDVSWHTLADLGAKMAIYRRRNGIGGFEAQSWLTRHFRGSLYRLHRLQYERIRLRPYVTTGSPLVVGPALNIHIPEDGPLTPASCDESLRAARDFFARHYPEEKQTVAVCRSWLLDDQLAEYLPPSANILQFQRRFQPLAQTADGDEDVFRFVFGREPGDVAGLHETLPQDTTLQRAIVAHVRSGRHWRIRTGYLAL